MFATLTIFVWVAIILGTRITRDFLDSCTTPVAEHMQQTCDVDNNCNAIYPPDQFLARCAIRRECYANTTAEQHAQRRERDRARYARRTPEQIAKQRERDRARYARRSQEQVAADRARDRAEYASMTEDKRKGRQCKRNSRNASRRNTPSQHSIVGSNSIEDPDCVYQNLPDATHLLNPEDNCDQCGAKRFEYESPGFCCQKGKVELSTADPPEALQILYTSSDSNAKHFRDSIRYFNGHFSFTTLVVNLDNRYANMTSGVYTFRAHGQIYHNIHSFGPSADGLDHLELYFYDDDPMLQHRFRLCKNKDKIMKDQHVIRSLVNILKDNPYSETFRSLGGVQDLEEYRVTLNTNVWLDQRTYNTPITSEVAAIWVEGNEVHKRADREIVLFGNNNTRYSIRPHFGCYDPLSYPLFFPRGELGWHPEIPKRGVPLSRILQSRSNNHQDPGKP